MDLFEQCRGFTRARDAMSSGHYPYFLRLDANEGTTVRYEGRELVMCGSNNYLGLTTDPRVRESSRRALDDFGPSCTGSRFLNGNLALHEQLEAELAAFFGKPAALVFATGYQANLGVITALLRRSDEVVIDAQAHASIVDACLLAHATVRRFRHNDPEDLRRKLAASRREGGRLVVVDGVYSMEGDLCRLPELVEVCHHYGARLVVDDAHGAGVLAEGRGTVAHFGLTDAVDLISLTFSKAFASLGGAVVGDEDVIHFIRHHARSMIFSASMSPPSTAAALSALRIIRSEPWRCRAVQENGAFLRAGLHGLGFDVGASETPIVPVLTGDVLSTLTLWRDLLDRGVYTNAVVPPAASPRLRGSVMATHTRQQLEQVLAAFARAQADLLAEPLSA